MDRPIIFSAPMVQALLAGRKTQTRRVLKRQPFRTDERALQEVRLMCGYRRGDRLWVRETWAVGAIYDRTAPRDINPRGEPNWCGIRYAATDERIGIKDRRSIHMPRWASRLTLHVTDVRVQRLQEISEEDAKAEGLTWVAPTWGVPGLAESFNGSPRDAFSAVWWAIHGLQGPASWDANPWVAAISFTVERANIDSAGRAA